MKIKRLIVGNNGVNCYLVVDENNSGIIIDPGAEPERIYEFIEKEGIEITRIINTHNHFDHIGANDIIKEKTGCKLYIHKNEKEYPGNPEKNLSAMLGQARQIISQDADNFLTEGDLISVGSDEFEIIHTPGHSPGSISLYNMKNKILFSGDLIFDGGMGRVDFNGGDYDLLLKTIKKKILVLDDNTRIYPGHGIKFTIKHFKETVWNRLAD